MSLPGLFQEIAEIPYTPARFPHPNGLLGEAMELLGREQPLSQSDEKIHTFTLHPPSHFSTHQAPPFKSVVISTTDLSDNLQAHMASYYEHVDRARPKRKASAMGGESPDDSTTRARKRVAALPPATVEGGTTPVERGSQRPLTNEERKRLFEQRFLLHLRNLLNAIETSFNRRRRFRDLPTPPSTQR